ncbi:MAG: DinB family protein [Actinomycetota bacterium]
MTDAEPRSDLRPEGLPGPPARSPRARRPDRRPDRDPRRASPAREGAGEKLRTRPEEKEWSVLECIGHLTDAEIVYSGRYRWILAHSEPPLIGYDQDLWVDALHRDDHDASALIEVFSVLRRANLDLWRSTGEAGRARVGMHAERGPESFDLSFRLIAGHDRFHLNQAEATLRAIGG